LYDGEIGCVIRPNQSIERPAPLVEADFVAARSSKSTVCNCRYVVLGQETFFECSTTGLLVSHQPSNARAHPECLVGLDVCRILLPDLSTEPESFGMVVWRRRSIEVRHRSQSRWPAEIVAGETGLLCCLVINLHWLKLDKTILHQMRNQRKKCNILGYFGRDVFTLERKCRKTA
jgi:hypothetical protein